MELQKSLYYLGRVTGKNALPKRDEQGRIIPEPFNLHTKSIRNNYSEKVKEQEIEKKKLEEKIKYKNARIKALEVSKSVVKPKVVLLMIEIKITPCRSAVFEYDEGDILEDKIDKFIKENDVDKTFRNKLIKSISKQLKKLDSDNTIPPPPPPLDESITEI